MGDRSQTLYHAWRESSEKFDYFVTGLSGALTAYVGQNIHPARLGLNATTIEVAALAALVGSVVGFKRIEATIHFHWLQTQSVEATEERGKAITAAITNPMSITSSGAVVTPQQLMARAETRAEKYLDPHIKEAQESVRSAYHLRNWLLLVGFALLVVARLVPAYLPATPVP